MPRFFVDPSAVSGDRIILTGDNAHHAAYSLRLAPGDRIKVCDQQTAYLCEMVSFDSETATARILSATPIDTEPPFIARLYQALPKGDKLDTIIQKAVECGVTEVIPFESSRCIVRAKPEAEGRKTERRCRIAEEAAKQCGRGIIPRVLPYMRYTDAIKTVDGPSFLCYEDERSYSLKEYLGEFVGMGEKKLSFFVGPEGGYAKDEVDLALQNGIPSAKLGNRILRSETASGFVLSCIAYALEL